MTKAENILKVVMTPHEPSSTFVDQFLRLLPESDSSEFQKILDMKVCNDFQSRFTSIYPTLIYAIPFQCLKTAEKSYLAGLFQPHSPNFVTGSHISSPKHDTSNVRKLDNLIKKFS